MIPLSTSNGDAPKRRGVIKFLENITTVLTTIMFSLWMIAAGVRVLWLMIVLYAMGMFPWITELAIGLGSRMPRNITFHVISTRVLDVAVSGVILVTTSIRTFRPHSNSFPISLWKHASVVAFLLILARLILGRRRKMFFTGCSYLAVAHPLNK